MRNGRRLVAVLGLAIVAGACGGLGLGEAGCEVEVRNPSVANLLTVQAVPTARYTPCLDELRLGWDQVEFFARDGEAGLEVWRGVSRFLTATVTASCDPSGAIKVAWDHPDIARYEKVEFEEPEVGVAIIPTGADALDRARRLAEELANVEVNDRIVLLSVDENVQLPIASRVSLAMARNHFVWIVSELDVVEGTLELRSATSSLRARGIDVDEALDQMERALPGVFYRGQWYFVFDGGCITYDFDATGAVAESLAEDAEEALGFYPAYQLRQIGEELGLEVG